MGVQASLWTEFCNKPEDVDYLLFPRLSALAEGAWTQTDRKDWQTYLKAMDRFNEHIAAKGIVYARSMYNIQHTVTPVDGQLQVKLECVRPDVQIHYTTDGKEPDLQSALYSEPLRLTTSKTVKAATFANGEQIGKHWFCRWNGIKQRLNLFWEAIPKTEVVGEWRTGQLEANRFRMVLLDE